MIQYALMNQATSIDEGLMGLAMMGFLSMLMMLWLGFMLFVGQKSIVEAMRFVGALALFLILYPLLHALLQAALPKLLLLGIALVAIIFGTRALFSLK